MKALNSYIKIRNLKDNEKNEAQRDFQEAADAFKMQAKDLYQLLKKKEKIEESFKQKLAEKSQVETLQSYHQYLNFLTPSILTAQQKVNKARKKMNQLQEVVTEQYIEVKKVDKLIENKKNQFQKMERKQDALMMDEISMRNYSQIKER